MITHRRPILGYENLYELDIYGVIYSLSRSFVNYRGTITNLPEHVMKVFTSRQGYAIISLYTKCYKKSYRVHRLVWEAFKGKIPEGLQINHIDGDKLNNTLDNLELMTPKENVNHAWNLGLANGPHVRAVNLNHPNCKISIEDIKLIRTLHESRKITQRKLAIRFKVSYQTISKIIRLERRNHA